MQLLFFSNYGEDSAAQGNKRAHERGQGIMFVFDPGGAGVADEGHQAKSEQRVQYQNNAHLVGFDKLNGK